MKYPLTIIDKMMNVYRTDFQYRYDIACVFHKILLRTSLSAKVKTLSVTGVVPAFHGHAHNRTCQLANHPLYVDGSSKEDFEGCEQVFSQSNAMASITRFASAFHRHQIIKAFFKHWDEEKHVKEGTADITLSVIKSLMFLQQISCLTIASKP